MEGEHMLNLACTTITSSLTLNPLSAITWSFGSNHDTKAQLLEDKFVRCSPFIAWRYIRKLSHVIKENLPLCFKKFNPHVRCIFDCTEVVIETPSSLDTQAQFWRDYKHHCTLKFLVAITPTSPDDIARFPQVLGGIDYQSSLYHH
jgi:hypothetical protein